MLPISSLLDPSDGGSLVASAIWILALLTGQLAATVATIAVAAIGLLMLQGRVPLRRGATVVIGCFIIFAASSIAAGLAAIAEAVRGDDNSAPVGSVAAVPEPPIVPPQPQVYDPYAGASVPVR